MSTTYAILLPGDENAWANADPEERNRVYGLHTEFMKALAERGHTMTGGAELTHSSTGRVVRGTRDSVTVTDGPYAETVEQLTGFYLVQTEDLNDLLAVCGIISDGDAVEVRACLQPDSDGG